DPRSDPLVDHEVAPVPVVLLRHVGQCPLAVEGQRRDARRLVALDEQLGGQASRTCPPRAGTRVTPRRRTPSGSPTGARRADRAMVSSTTSISICAKAAPRQ